MSDRSEALAKKFEAAVDDLVKAIDECSDAKWQSQTEEEWSVAATAHHVAFQWSLEKEYLDAAVNGATSPQYSWDDIHKRNADHAAKFQSCTKEDAIKELRSGAPAMASFVRGLSDAQLDATMALPLADGATVTATQLIEGGVLIDHAVAHAKSIRGAG